MGAYVTINPTPSGDITGSGTPNYLAMFTSANVIGDSVIYQSGSKVYVSAANTFAVNTSTPSFSVGYDSQTITIAGVSYSAIESSYINAGTSVNNQAMAASATASVASVYLGARSRGTFASPTAVQSGDSIHSFYSVGHDGTDYAIATAVEHIVGGTVAANQVPGRIKFSTANSSGTLTEAMSIYSTQQVSIGNYASPTNLRVLTIGQDTAYMSFGSLVGTTSNSAVYMNEATPSATNYTLAYTASNEISVNAVSTLRLRANNTISATVTSTGVAINSSGGLSITNNSNDTKITTTRTGGDTYSLQHSATRFYIYNNTALVDLITFNNVGSTVFTSVTSTSGAITPYTLNISANTGQTASTEISNFKVNGASKTWAAGAITTQRWNYFTANTAAFASASTITNSYGLYVEAATAGSNATITNNWALGTNDNIKIDNTSAGKGVYFGNGFVGVWSTSNAYVGFHHSSVTASTGYAIIQDGVGNTFVNSGTTLGFRIANSTNLSLTASLLTFSDSVNIAFNATTGTKFGTAPSQKLSFWNATPIVQPTTAVAAATFAANTSGIANDTATFDGYTIGQVVKALRNTGLLA